MPGVKGRSGRRAKRQLYSGGNLLRPVEIKTPDALRIYNFMLQHMPEVKSCDELYLLMAARTFEKWQYCSRFIEANGLSDSDGKMRPEAKLERHYYRDLLAILREIGATPESRSKLLSHGSDGEILEQTFIDLDMGESI